MSMKYTTVYKLKKNLREIVSDRYDFEYENTW